jgi:type III secretion protein S
MEPVALIELTQSMLVIVLIISMPIVLLALLIGLLVGLLQAVTQIQDQSIAHGAKIIGAAIAIALLMGWAGNELIQYATRSFDMIQHIGR